MLYTIIYKFLKNLWDHYEHSYNNSFLKYDLEFDFTTELSFSIAIRFTNLLLHLINQLIRYVFFFVKTLLYEFKNNLPFN